MDKFRNSHGMIIKTTMCVKEEYLNSSEFNIKEVIDHLVKHKSYITGIHPHRKELFDLCTSTLQSNKDDLVLSSASVLPGRSNSPVRTFFHPSCRIIHIDLTETPRSHRTTVRSISVQEHECGYRVSKNKGSHACLVIKIERMTDVSCFASWSLLR